MPGRGGAGNYEAAAATVAVKAPFHGPSQQPKPPLQVPEPDLEANHNRNEVDGFAHTGRGGAGNFISTSTTTSISSSPTPANPNFNSNVDPNPTPVSRGPYIGRGGAGNFIVEDTARVDEEEKPEKKEKADALRRIVAEDVEKGLARPEGVWLGGREKEREGQVVM